VAGERVLRSVYIPSSPRYQIAPDIWGPQQLNAVLFHYVTYGEATQANEVLSYCRSGPYAAVVVTPSKAGVSVRMT
jgi:hypothetical protein